jgi:magnesium transporter
MTELQISPGRVSTSASALLGRSVLGLDGKVLGRVRELAVDVSADQTHVAALILGVGSGRKAKKTLLPVVELVWPGSNEAELRAKAMPASYKEHHDYLLLDYDLLDQQIIDVDGRKVVRVNDVNLAWEPGAGVDETAGLLIEEVEVGNRGAMRRLFKGLPVAMVDDFVGRLSPRVIPWACVDLIERDPARRVRLKIGQERLAKLHPSDIADILEDLAPSEREAVFSSLPEETAAETLEEVDPKMQKALLQGLDSERAADILEEMDPEERQDVEELLEFSADSAAGRMTTDYVSAPKDATVADAIQALREFEGDPDTITEIYLLDEDQRLAGVVMLPRLVLSTAETTLAVLSEGHNVRCRLDASDREVAELFDKYNLRSLPVVDHHGRVAGAIHAEQVIAQLREG